MKFVIKFVTLSESAEQTSWNLNFVKLYEK